jgi:hypothetical protein
MTLHGRNCRGSYIAVKLEFPGAISTSESVVILFITLHKYSNLYGNSLYNRFQNVYPGGLFEGSNGIAITGGNFDQTHGDRQNVTIHLHVNSKLHLVAL